MKYLMNKRSTAFISTKPDTPSFIAMNGDAAKQISGARLGTTNGFAN